VGRSTIPRKRRPSMDKETCWELAAKAQHIVDVETFYNTKKK
jgi:hypothetical protein